MDGRRCTVSSHIEQYLQFTFCIRKHLKWRWQQLLQVQKDENTQSELHVLYLHFLQDTDYVNLTSLVSADGSMRIAGCPQVQYFQYTNLVLCLMCPGFDFGFVWVLGFLMGLGVCWTLEHQPNQTLRLPYAHQHNEATNNYRKVYECCSASMNYSVLSTACSTVIMTN